jgi:pantetheine-phosphate adenylyltransferase
MPTLAVIRSFDPLTNGHVDIITRGARLFEASRGDSGQCGEVAALHDAKRVDVARTVFRHLPNVEVDTFNGLLVDYVAGRQAQVIVRGLRAVSTSKSSFDGAMNQRLNGKIETVFMMPAEQHLHQLAPHQRSLLARRCRAWPGAGRVERLREATTT